MTKEVDSNIVAAAFDNVFKFNDISKQFEGDVLAGINLQLDLIFEEFCTETIPAFEEGCNAVDSHFIDLDEANKQAEKLLDGAVDTFVVVSGLLQKLHAAGMDINAALLRVTENNLSKFPKKVEYNWCEKQGYTPVFNDKHACFVLKDANGKTRKNHDYKSVDLGDLVPTNFFKEAQYG